MTDVNTHKHDLEVAAGLASTGDGCELLHIQVWPGHHYAGKTYLSACRDINSLLKENADLLEALELLLGLTLGLQEDDPYFFDQRGGDVAVSTARAAIARARGAE